MNKTLQMTNKRYWTTPVQYLIEKINSLRS